MLKDRLYKSGKYFNVKYFRQNIRAGDELTFTIMRDYLLQTNNNRIIYGLSSGDHVFLDAGRVAEFSEENALYALYMALGLPVLYVIIFIAV